MERRGRGRGRGRPRGRGRGRGGSSAASGLAGGDDWAGQDPLEEMAADLGARVSHWHRRRADRAALSLHTGLPTGCDKFQEMRYCAVVIFV